LEYYLHFKINTRQAAYHFILVIPQKLQEQFDTEPQPNFSACFGTIYTSSTKYAEMLSKKIQEVDVKVC
jgi:ATP-dependent phosphoenolpyruvate carboxykinase